MQLIHEDKQKRVIREKEEIKFSSYSTFHLIVITARTKGEKQISPESTDDEDLIVKIDGKVFPKLTDSNRLIDSPAAFSGGELHNLSKTIYFLTFLKGRDHTIVLKSDEPFYTAAFESLAVYTLTLNESLTLKVESQAEEGDRRPWMTFVLVDLPLTSFSITASVQKRYRDSDDLKIIVDGETKTHFESKDERPSDPLPLQWFYRFWYFIGSILLGQIRIAYFKTNLHKNLHYIELYADRMPTLETVKFDFGEIPSPSPTEKIQEYKDEVFGRDYNQLDRYILETVSFWNEFFLKQEYPPPEPLDPNLVKAIIYRESDLGYYPDQSVVDVMQVWGDGTPQGLLGEKGYSANEFITPDKIDNISYSYPKNYTPPRVTTRKESIFWGVRWLYHKAQYLQTVPNSEVELAKPYVRKWRSWEDAIRKYNANEEIAEKYIKEVFTVYEKGVDLDGNVLWKK